MVASKEEKLEFLSEPRTLAIIGASTKEQKAGHYVPKFLKEVRNFTIIPVNPFEDEVLGEKTVDDLSDISSEIDGVVIYRHQEAAEEEALKAVGLKDELNLSMIWLPEKVTSEKAMKKAEEEGLKFVQDDCPMRFTKTHIL